MVVVAVSPPTSSEATINKGTKSESRKKLPVLRLPREQEETIIDEGRASSYYQIICMILLLKKKKNTNFPFVFGKYFGFLGCSDYSEHIVQLEIVGR